MHDTPQTWTVVVYETLHDITQMRTAARYKTVRGTSHWKVNNDYILLPTFGSSITPDWIRSQLLGGLQGGGMTQDRGESWTSSSFISCIRGLWILSSLISSSDEGGRNFVSFRPPPCKYQSALKEWTLNIIILEHISQRYILPIVKQISEYHKVKKYIPYEKDFLYSCHHVSKNLSFICTFIYHPSCNSGSSSGKFQFGDRSGGRLLNVLQLPFCSFWPLDWTTYNKTKILLGWNCDPWNL